MIDRTENISSRFWKLDIKNEEYKTTSIESRATYSKVFRCAWSTRRLCL